MFMSRVVTRHAKSDMHIDAVKLQEEADRSKRDSGIRAAFDHVWEMEEASLTTELSSIINHMKTTVITK